MKLSDFDYDLPEKLIAQYPPKERGESRLMLLDRGSGEVRETRFANFPRYLQEGDLLVINETKVIPARIFGRKTTGGNVEVFLVRRTGDREWEAMLRPSKRFRGGDIVLVGDQGYQIRIEERVMRGEWIITLPGDIGEGEFIDSFGHVPLPPYIKREDEPHDRVRYQTVYAKLPGSVAAPTAGLHFTDDVLGSIKRRGINVLPLTLHVGPGTFRPLDYEAVEKNRLKPEHVVMRKKYWREIQVARRNRRRVVAVGTTTMRALESLAIGRFDGLEERSVDGEVFISGWTDLFIYPGFKFTIVDALLTNLHLPRSSLLLLVAAFAGEEGTLRAYNWAVKRRFQFYSYGDAMFIR